MNALGFDRYTARYLVRLKDASFLKPSVVAFEWRINKYTADIFVALGRVPIAVYLFIGANAASHALDLFNGYDITWSGTLTHNTLGTTGDDATGKGILGFKLPNVLPNNTLYALGLYSRTATLDDTWVDMGCTTGGGATAYLRCRRTTGTVTAGYISDSVGLTTAAGGATGLHVIARTSSSSCALYRNGVATVSSTATFVGLPNIEPAIFSYNFIGTNVPGYYTARSVPFAFVGGGVIDHAALYTAVQALQTYLGRQV